jgi:hypothetical protein
MHGSAKMDWVQVAQVTTAIATGAAGLATIQRIIRELKRDPTRPVQNGERRSIISHLTRLEQIGINQERMTARMEGRLDEMEDRLRDVERLVARISARSASQG